jgi:hypothetical protein
MTKHHPHYMRAEPVMSRQAFARIGLCAAAIALSSAGYTAIAYAGPGACDVSSELNCQGVPRRRRRMIHLGRGRRDRFPPIN